MKKIFTRKEKNPILWTSLMISLVSAMVCTVSSCGKTDTKSEADSEPVVTTVTTNAETSETTAASALTTEKASTTVSTTASSATSASKTTSTAAQTTTTQAVQTMPPVQTQPPVKPPVQTTAQPPVKPPAVTTAPPATQPPVVTTQKPAVIPTGTSPNSAFYQQNIVIAGDSIATGFSLFGFVPSNHSISLGSLSMSNMDWYYPQNKGVSFVDAAAATKTKLLYMSMGMNDVNMTTADKYAAKYVSVINQILAKAPNTTIVAAGITPVTDGISFTNNAKIRSFNAALANAVRGMNSDRVYYFDSYSVLADPGTLGLRQGYSSGDGIHLATGCYSQLLNALYNMLDTTPALQHMQG